MEHNIEKNATDKWYPANRDELLELVKDKDVYLGDIDTSRITDMSDLFGGWKKNKGSIEYRDDYSGIETWDVSKVENMSGMFSGCGSFNADISGWDVSNVKNMKYMFLIAKSFNQPIGNWDVSKVTDMNGMFLEAKSFNQPIGSWNVSKVKDMRMMFFRAESFNQPIDDWDMSNVTNMRGMFWDAHSFKQHRKFKHIKKSKNNILHI